MSAPGDPFETVGPVKRLPRTWPMISSASAVLGFVPALLHTQLFGLFTGLGPALGALGYVLCLLVPVGSFFLIEVQKRKMQEEFRSRFDSYDAMKVVNLQKRVSIAAIGLALLPMWYLAAAVGELFQ